MLLLVTGKVTVLLCGTLPVLNVTEPSDSPSIINNINNQL